MKKTLILISFFLAAFGSQAQIPGFTLGPKVGYNTLKLSTDLSKFTSDPGGAFQFGAFCRIGKKIYVQPEVNYVIKGGKVSLNENEYVKIRLTSVTVPVLVGLRLFNTGFFNIRVMMGPAFSYVADKTLTMKDPLPDFPVHSADDLVDSMWSMQFGGGVDLLNFTIDCRYEVGVDNLYNGKEDFSLKNNLFNISLGFKLL